MADVKIYTSQWCGYCTAALRLLRQKGVAFQEIDCTRDPDKRRWLVETTGRRTVPQVFIDGRAVGGFTDLRALDERGVLDRLLGLERQGSSASG